MSAHILVVEDERPIADILRFNLEREGFRVTLAPNGEDALRHARESSPDIILLDIMLPKMDGYQVCKEIRSQSTIPIIMLTAREEEQERIRGLELGADDYVVKPFSPREVVARIRAILRRAGAPGGGVLRLGELEIDLDNRGVKKAGKPIDLTVREFELLRFLVTQAGQVFSRETLLQQVWSYQYLGDIRTVDVTVRRLREKIEENPSDPRIVMTKRGLGYFFARPDQAS